MDKSKNNTERGKGGLRKSLLFVTIAPLMLVSILLVFVGSAIYSKAFQDEVSKNLTAVANAIIEHYDICYEGDYNLLIDNTNQKTYLKKGGFKISDSPKFIDDYALATGTEITIFFYDTRMMTTLNDANGNRLINTIANPKIVENVISGKSEYFFNGVEIDGSRYCAQYIPIFSSNGTCTGMIGVAQPYTQVSWQVNKLIITNVAVMIFAMILVAACMIWYTSSLAGSLTDIRNFLKEIEQGNLDTDINMKVLSRDDEIGDMGRLTNSVRGTLKKLVEKDPLTNLNNRRSGKIKMEQIRNKAEKYGNQYSVAMGDIDFFKKVNDTYGHDAGDIVLKTVARILSDHMSGHGIVNRWGGEEFLFIFDKEDEMSAAKTLSEILDEIRETVVEYGDEQIKFTMSYGVITGDYNRTAEDDINLADERLYYAKENGRNRIVTSAEYLKEEKEETIMAADKKDELWDIYDKDKQLTGRTMKRNVWTLADDEYHLTVLGVVVNKEGKYLITKRVMTKSWAPGWWEVSGGAAMAGETSETAVKREVLEETGLDVNGAEGGYKFTYHRENPGQGDNYFVDVYRFVVDFKEEDLKLQTEETDGYMLATVEEIEAFAKEGIFLHYDSIKEVFE